MTNLLTKEQIEDLLSYIGVDKVQQWKGDKIQFCCPIHGESHPSCGINADYQKDFHSPITQVFNCFSCHESGDLVWFLYKSMPDTFKSVGQARKFLEKRYNVDFNKRKRFNIVSNKIPRYESSFIDLEEKQEQRIVLPMSRLAVYKSGKETYSYYFKRGFNKSDMKEYMIGRDLKNKTITMPVFYEDGELAGVIGRYINPNQRHGARFKIYDDFKRGMLIYPLDKIEVIDSTLIMVESILDVQMMRKWGIKNVFALMGSSMSEVQADIVRSLCTKVIDLLDNDEMGHRARKIVRKRLGKSVMYLTVNYPDEKYGKDPCEWGEKLTKKTLVTAKLYGTNNLKRI